MKLDIEIKVIDEFGSSHCENFLIKSAHNAAPPQVKYSWYGNDMMMTMMMMTTAKSAN